jgi:hypothetical protein
MMHEFIGTVLVELLWVLSLILFAVGHHVRIASEEVASLRHFFNLNGILRCIVIVIIITLADLHISLVILLLLEVFVLIVFFGLRKIITLIARLFITILFIHHFGLLNELIVLLHFLGFFS